MAIACLWSRATIGTKNLLESRLFDFVNRPALSDSLTVDSVQRLS